MGVLAPAPLVIETEVFSGTLAMLIKSVQTAKIDPLDIPLAPVVQAYVEYLGSQDIVNLDEAAVSVAFLAFLLERKCYRLIPVEAVEEDHEELPEPIEPYIQEYGHILTQLEERFEERSKHFFREAGVPDGAYEPPIDLGEIMAADLAQCFARVMSRAIEPEFPVFAKSRRSLLEQMQIVLDAMRTEYQTLLELLPARFTREDVVWWFLSILELMKAGRIRARLDDDTEVRFALC